MKISQQFLTRRAILRDGAILGAAGAVGMYAPTVIGQAWDHVFENLDVSTPSVLEGSQWNNTLIRNCRIHNVSGNGLTLRNVDTVRVENCVFETISENAIHLSVTGGTKNVTLIGNRISNCGKNGIAAGQRYQQRVDQKNLRVLDNRIENTGLVQESKPGLLHGIYVQCQDFLIQGNTVINAVDGNGISVRSSGVVRGNSVDGTGKSGIAYYADHMRGPSNHLLIEQNEVRDAGRNTSRCSIDLLEIPNRRYAVRNFTIRGNQIAQLSCGNNNGINVHSDYNSTRYNVTIIP